ncbi:MAG: type II toxin-antitoxin system RelE/ParE family toxin [Clostridia bacterium]|nr:type II toxin-antitoxin system RelE/ParE family toxin [Clostridia bacterium]
MENYNIILSPCAVASIEEIYEYISESLHEPTTALKNSQQIFNTIFSLKVLPTRIKLSEIESLKSKNIRIIYANNYAILFTVNEFDVVILDVIYSRSNIEVLFS